MCQTVATTLFRNGTVWTGASGPTVDAVLVDGGVVVAVGEAARAMAAEQEPAEVDLEGGFLMPSFGDGHAHPLLGGLEFVGPAVRPCSSVEEIVAEVRKYAEANPDEEWIVGASYDGS